MGANELGPREARDVEHIEIELDILSSRIDGASADGRLPVAGMAGCAYGFAGWGVVLILLTALGLGDAVSGATKLLLLPATVALAVPSAYLWLDQAKAGREAEREELIGRREALRLELARARADATRRRRDEAARALEQRAHHGGNLTLSDPTSAEGGLELAAPGPGDGEAT
jgi:hypothetical protein